MRKSFGSIRLLELTLISELHGRAKSVISRFARARISSGAGSRPYFGIIRRTALICASSRLVDEPKTSHGKAVFCAER